MLLPFPLIHLSQDYKVHAVLALKHPIPNKGGHRIEILINKKLEKVDRHLASYIGKLDKNIYQLLASSLLLLRSSRSDLYEKYSEEEIVEFLSYKGDLLSKNKVSQTD